MSIVIVPELWVFSPPFSWRTDSVHASWLTTGAPIHPLIVISRSTQLFAMLKKEEDF